LAHSGNFKRNNKEYRIMTLFDLQEQVADMIRRNPDAGDLEVYAVSDYGDRCHTKQLVELGDLDTGFSKETAFSDSGLALQKDFEIDGESNHILVLG
jgi:hypothetical protein